MAGLAWSVAYTVIAATPQPLQLQTEVKVTAANDGSGDMMVAMVVKETKTGETYDFPGIRFKKGEKGGHKLKKGFPDLGGPGWAEVDVTVGISADGHEVTYSATTKVGIGEPFGTESVAQTQNATFHLGE
jgi:hypothetical protein